MASRKTTAATAATPAPTPAPTAAPATAPVARPARKAAPPAAAAAPAPQPDKPRKADKPKKAPKVRPLLVRDSFTMPEADFALIGTLKARALAGRRETKKSELLRAGLQALAAMDGATLLAALNALEPIKTGRPKKA
jgi:hypothetical protein